MKAFFSNVCFRARQGCALIAIWFSLVRDEPATWACAMGAGICFYLAEGGDDECCKGGYDE